MMKDRVAVDNIRERCGIQNDKNRSQDRSLMGTGAERQLFTVIVIVPLVR